MTTMASNGSVPDGWKLAPLSELGNWSGGGTPSKARSEYWTKGTIPWVSPKDMKTSRIRSTGDRITERALENSACAILKSGAVLVVVRSGILQHSLPVAVTDVPVAINQDLKALLPVNGVSPGYVTYAFRRFANEILRDCSKDGVTVQSIEFSRLLEFAIPVAPTNEQHRVVEVADTLLSKTDAALAALERVRANLKRYRASVLKAAVEGRLVPTEAELARREGRDFEPASVLLVRILAERRRRWEEFELARLKGAGKPHKNDEWKSRYKEPVALDTRTLPQLPDGWCWAPLDALASVAGGVTKGQRRKPTDELRQVPYLRVANVQRGYLDLSVIKEIEATENEIKELHLKSGDVLFNEGGDRDKLGRGWVWNGEIPECIHQNHVFRARMYTQDLLPRFLSWYGNSSAQLFFLQEGKQTTNLASLNSTNLKKLPVPLPPLAEQKRIAAEIELSLSVADATVKTTDAAIARCNRLRQSILKWAFEGKLVDQDPNDEPASALLERIRTDRATAPHSHKSKKHDFGQTEAAK